MILQSALNEMQKPKVVKSTLTLTQWPTLTLSLSLLTCSQRVLILLYDCYRMLQSNVMPRHGNKY